MAKFSNPLKRKSKKNEDNDSRYNVNKAVYKIRLYDPMGESAIERKEFFAYRWVDAEDFVVYLRKDFDDPRKSEPEFLEIFPQQTKDFKNYDLKGVQKRLDELRQMYQGYKDRDNRFQNDQDLEFEIMKLEAKKRSLEYSSKATYSYMSGGYETFNFLRLGSSKLPFKWDLDTKSIYIPSDTKKKSASLLLRNKQHKYSKHQKIVNGASVFMLVLLIVGVLGNFYLGWNMWTSYDKSNIAEARRACLKDMQKATEAVKDTAKSANGIIEAAKEQINKETTVIRGPGTKKLNSSG